MLAIADPSREETVGMLASLPSRTGQLQDRTQVGQDRAAGRWILTTTCTGAGGPGGTG